MFKWLLNLLTSSGVEITEEQKQKIQTGTKEVKFFENEQKLTDHVDAQKKAWTEAQAKAKEHDELIKNSLEKAGVKKDMQEDFIKLTNINELTDEAQITEAISKGLESRSYFKEIADPQIKKNNDDNNSQKGNQESDAELVL